MYRIKFISLLVIGIGIWPLNAQQARVIPYFGHEQWSFEEFSVSGVKGSGNKVRSLFWTHTSIENWQNTSIGFRQRINNYMFTLGADHSAMGELHQNALHLGLSRKLGERIAIGLQLQGRQDRIEGYSNQTNLSTGLQARYSPANRHSIAAMMTIPVKSNSLPRFRMHYINYLSSEVKLQLDIWNNYTGHPQLGVSIGFRPERNWLIELEQGITPLWTDLVIGFRQLKKFEVDMISRYQPGIGYSIGLGISYFRGT